MGRHVRAVSQHRVRLSDTGPHLFLFFLFFPHFLLSRNLTRDPSTATRQSQSCRPSARPSTCRSASDSRVQQQLSNVARRFVAGEGPTKLFFYDRAPQKSTREPFSSSIVGHNPFTGTHAVLLSFSVPFLIFHDFPLILFLFLFFPQLYMLKSLKMMSPKIYTFLLPFFFFFFRSPPCAI